MILETIQDYEDLQKKYEHYDYAQYVYRGHSNKDWSLLPSAYRDKSNIECPDIEKISVDKFIRHLIENGYRDFPFDDIIQFDFLTKPTTVFPTVEQLPYFALAQHYAFDSQFHWLKTSLLDVTYNLDIAAYFAVEKEAEENADGKIFVLDFSKINAPYKFYEPKGGFRIEARLVVQQCAFIYREQECTPANDHLPYKNKNPFDDIVIDTIIIKSELKPQLKEKLQKKLFELFIYPRLVLGRVIPDLSTSGLHSFEELEKMHKPAVDRVRKLGDKHSSY